MADEHQDFDAFDGAECPWCGDTEAIEVNTRAGKVTLRCPDCLEADLQIEIDSLKGQLFRLEHFFQMLNGEQKIGCPVPETNLDKELAIIDLCGFPRPQCMADWEQLARRVGVPFEIVRSRSCSYREVAMAALAWSERERFRKGHVRWEPNMN